MRISYGWVRGSGYNAHTRNNVDTVYAQGGAKKNKNKLINLFVQYSQSYLPPLRPLCGEATDRDLKLGRVELVAGSLTGPLHDNVKKKYKNTFASFPS